MTYVQTGVNVHVTWRRIFATTVDSIVLGLVFSFVAKQAGHPVDTSDLDLTQLFTSAGPIGALFAAVYYILFESLAGATIGKWVFGIRVIDARTGRRPGIVQALVRTALRLIDGLGGYLLGWIVVLISSRRRRLGDMAANTQVIRRP